MQKSDISEVGIQIIVPQIRLVMDSACTKVIKCAYPISNSLKTDCNSPNHNNSNIVSKKKVICKAYDFWWLRPIDNIHILHYYLRYYDISGFYLVSLLFAGWLNMSREQQKRESKKKKNNQSKINTQSEIHIETHSWDNVTEHTLPAWYFVAYVRFYAHIFNNNNNKM